MRGYKVVLRRYKVTHELGSSALEADQAGTDISISIRGPLADNLFVFGDPPDVPEMDPKNPTRFIVTFKPATHCAPHETVHSAEHRKQDHRPKGAKRARSKNARGDAKTSS